jgi:hypothetical protein
VARVFARDSLHLQTIPQTLGAAFAVLAAFVIYRFQTDPAMGHAVAQMLEMFNRDRALSAGKPKVFLLSAQHSRSCGRTSVPIGFRPEPGPWPHDLALELPAVDQREAV